MVGQRIPRILSAWESVRPLKVALSCKDTDLLMIGTCNVISHGNTGAPEGGYLESTGQLTIHGQTVIFLNVFGKSSSSNYERVVIS